METTKKLLAIIIFALFSMSMSLVAQETESQNSQEPQTTQDTLNDQNTQGRALDTVNATEGIVVDTAGKSSFHTIARDMTIKLLEKMNISFDQAGDIEEILIEYQEDIAEAKNRGTAHGTDQSVTDTDTDENTATDDDNEILGGMDNDANLSEIDNETNSKIEEVFSDDQMNAYLFVKEDWWNEVKSRVYDTDSEQKQDEQEIDQDTEGEGNEQNQYNPDQQNPDTEQEIEKETDEQNEGQLQEDTSPDTGKTLDETTVPADSTNR